MADSSFGALHNWGVVGVWACEQVVDGLFMRLLSRLLRVVRLRWGDLAPRLVWMRLGL